MGKSGIYKITNIVNNKIYIGSAVNLIKRKTDHFRTLLYNKHHNNYLQKAFNKYGKENFIFEVIEECDKQYNIEREQFYMDLYNPEYNICRKAGSILGIKRSKETCEKLSKSNTGKKHSEETKKKMSEVRLGRFKGSNNFTAVKIVQFDLNGNMINKFGSVVEATKAIGLKSASCIHRSLSKKRVTAGGFIWKYEKEVNNA